MHGAQRINEQRANEIIASNAGKTPSLNPPPPHYTSPPPVLPRTHTHFIHTASQRDARRVNRRRSCVLLCRILAPSSIPLTSRRHTRVLTRAIRSSTLRRVARSSSNQECNPSILPLNARQFNPSKSLCQRSHLPKHTHAPTH